MACYPYTLYTPRDIRYVITFFSNVLKALNSQQTHAMLTILPVWIERILFNKIIFWLLISISRSAHSFQWLSLRGCSIDKPNTGTHLIAWTLPRCPYIYWTICALSWPGQGWLFSICWSWAGLFPWSCEVAPGASSSSYSTKMQNESSDFSWWVDLLWCLSHCNKKLTSFFRPCWGCYPHCE